MHDCQCRMAQPGKPHNTPLLIADLKCAMLVPSWNCAVKIATAYSGPHVTP